ncbi:MAG: type II toxin-antitoxin system VapC family toxin [Candidatus Binatia bacterium]
MSTTTWRRRTLPNPHRSTRSPAPGNGPAFVDSSGWIAFFSRGDAHHADASALMRAAVDGRTTLLTTNLVVAETQRLLLFRVGTAAASRALDVFDRSRHLTIHFSTPADHSAARQWIARLADLRLTYTDAVSFAAMQSFDCRGFVGFDRDFDAAGFVRWQP